MALLQIVQKVCRRLLLPQPVSAFGNADLTVQQLVDFAEDVGARLRESYNWRTLNLPCTFTGDGVTTVWTLPAGFDKFSAGQRLVYSVSPMTPLIGPVSNEDLLSLKSFPAALVVPVWRLIGNQIEIWPAMAAGSNVQFNYYSLFWIAPVIGSATDAYASDTDVSLMDEKLIRLGVIWRWKSSKGFEYAEDFRLYEGALANAQDREETVRVTAMSNTRYFPDNYWPGTVTYNGP